MLTFCLAGCGILNTLSATADYKKVVSESMTSDTMVTISAPDKSEPASEGAKKYGLMALFSHMTYLKHLPLKPTNERNEDCQKHANLHPMQKIDTRDASQLPAWRRWNNPAGCHSGEGLYYETYVYGKADSIERAVIAIRGTENGADQFWTDWATNFSAVFGIDPSEYQLAREKIQHTIAKLRTNPKVKIYLTGHSLGGGIAQQIAYTEPENFVAATYVFNTSPMTNWSFLATQHPSLVLNTDPLIYRIQERGEAAGLLRWVTTRVNFRRYGRSDHEFNFSKENPVKTHAMNLLACNFARLIEKQPSIAEFDYTPEMADRVFNDKKNPGINGEEPLCPTPLLDN